MSDVTLTGGPGDCSCIPAPCGTNREEVARTSGSWVEYPEGHVSCGLHSTPPALETGEDILTEAVGADCHWLTWLTLALSEPWAGSFKERKWDTVLPWRRTHLCGQRLDF